MSLKAAHIVGGLIAALAVSQFAQAQTMALPPVSVGVQNCWLKPKDCGLSFPSWDRRTEALRPPTTTCMPSPNTTCGKFLVPLKTLDPRIREALKFDYHVIPIAVESHKIPSGNYALILAKSTGPVPWANKAFVFKDTPFAVGNVTFKITALPK